jgi:hypothetical protein
MKKKWIGLVCLTIILSLTSVRFISAQTRIPSTELGFNTVHSQQEPQTISFNLTDLGFDEVNNLRGPYQTITGRFSLPYDWTLTGDVQLELRLTSEFQSLLEAFTEEDLADATPDRFGILRLALNGKRIGEQRVTESGNLTLQLEISQDDVLLEAQSNTLSISWDASAACQQSITTDISIDGASSISFPVETRVVTPAMRHFPAPFYVSNAIAAYPTAIIVPSDLDADTQSAFVAVAGGLGRQTGAQINLTVFRSDAVPTSVLENYHLILVGKDADLLTVFDALNADQIPQLGMKDVGDAGLLTLLPSAWNNQRAMLIVSGEDGEALRKSAAAVAADSFFTTSSGNQAVVTDVSDPLEGQQWQVNQTFINMFNEAEIVADTLGMEEVRLPFHVPADIDLSPEAYIELYFRHSQLINYLQSSVSVALNDKTIGTIRFGDQTATNGLARIILPPNSVRPLRNELTLTFTLVSQDLCADERSGNYWVTVFGDSYLHLPPVFEDSPLTERVYLDDLRDTFFGSSAYSDLSIVLGDTDADSLQIAADLALQLGAQTTANQMLIRSEMIDTLSIDADENTVILIAKSDHIAKNSVINSHLPLPFKQGGALPQVETSGVSFSLDPDQDFGNLQIIDRGEGLRPWLLISGNTNAGVGLALEVMLAKLRIPGSERATVKIIDHTGDEHAFLIENEVAQIPSDVNGEGTWKQYFSDGGSNRLALLLMIPVGLVTAIYVVWLLRQSRKNA